MCVCMCASCIVNLHKSHVLHRRCLYNYKQCQMLTITTMFVCSAALVNTDMGMITIVLLGCLCSTACT